MKGCKGGAYVGQRPSSCVEIPRVKGTGQRQVHFAAVDGQRDERHLGLQQGQAQRLELLVPGEGRERGDWAAIISSKLGRVQEQAGYQESNTLEADEDDVDGRGDAGDGGVVDGDAEDDGYEGRSD